MSIKNLTFNDNLTLTFVDIFFHAVNKFSATIEEFVAAEKARDGYCFFDLQNITNSLEKALKLGFVSKNGQLFELTLSSELAAEIIAERKRNLETFTANINSGIMFLENYLQERSQTQPA